ncbi:MAG: methyltransferase domain-containing protein [Candidatus Gracilibacteria bacterium]|jgi:23S rRNA (guanine745-N1)-methyltransferase|nr:methyltransferase domain-containing protein [Candidatus Gracilibacteria bacterium]
MNKKTIYRCPNCSSFLIRSEKAFFCENKHNFDIAKEAYVNLILANKKKSLKSGDTKEMILSRQKFLNSGKYDFLLSVILKELKKNQTKSSSILDIGCGSGYYIDCVKKKFPTSVCYGIDVSKASIINCSKNFPKIDFAVANSFDLPFLDKTFDNILSVFAPFKETEVERIIKKNGTLIVVRPGEKHFFEIYKRHNIPQKLKRKISFDRLNLAKTIKIQKKDSVLTTEQIYDLIAMTPLFWKIPKTEIIYNYKEITYDFIIDFYEAKNLP